MLFYSPIDPSCIRSTNQIRKKYFVLVGRVFTISQDGGNGAPKITVNLPNGMKTDMILKDIGGENKRYQGYLPNEPDTYVAVRNYSDYIIITSDFGVDSSIYKIYQNGTEETIPEPLTKGKRDISFEDLFGYEEQNSTIPEKCRCRPKRLNRQGRQNDELKNKDEGKINHKVFDTDDNLADKALDKYIIDVQNLTLRVSISLPFEVQ